MIWAGNGANQAIELDWDSYWCQSRFCHESRIWLKIVALLHSKTDSLLPSEGIIHESWMWVTLRFGLLTLITVFEGITCFGSNLELF